MRCRYIFSLSYLITALYLILKTRYSLYAANPESGFFFSKNVTAVVFLSAFVVIVLNFVLTLFLRRCPVKFPRVRMPLFIASLVLLVSLIADTVVTLASVNANYIVLQIILTVASVAFCAFLAAFSALYIVEFRINRYLYIIPLVFWLIKLVAEYIKTAKMSLISENGFKIIATAFIAIFFLYFAKYRSRIITENSHKAMMFFGFCSFSFAEFFAVPQLISFFRNGDIVVGNTVIVRNSVFELLLYFVTGLFILVYLHSFFSNKNLVRHRHSSHSKLLLAEENTVENVKNEETVTKKETGELATENEAETNQTNTEEISKEETTETDSKQE